MSVEEFRSYHASEIAKTFDVQMGPLDQFLRLYFRRHHALGSKDRKAVAETVYTLLRSKPTPEPLQRHLTAAYGEETAQELILASMERAPLTLRTNTLKISRDALLEKWRGLYDVRPTTHAPDGIVFQSPQHLSDLPEFLAGLFEVQDQASQKVAELVRVRPGDLVLDYCAGSGGKSLAIAPRMQAQGQLFLHDSRPSALAKARQRMRRAGIQNVQFGLPKGPLRGKMDWLLLDVPCSGTGTLRRNPDLKDRFSDTFLAQLIQEQRAIFAAALPHLRPGGTIVYATCSLLPEENEQQVAHFKATYNLDVVEEFRSRPQRGIPLEEQMDGFFAVVLKSLGGSHARRS